MRCHYFFFIFSFFIKICNILTGCYNFHLRLIIFIFIMTVIIIIIILMMIIIVILMMIIIIIIILCVSSKHVKRCKIWFCDP